MQNYFLRLVFGGLFVLFGLFFWFNPFEALNAYLFYIGLSYLILTGLLFVMAKKARLNPMPYQSFLVSLVIALIFLAFPNLSLSLVVGFFIALFLLLSFYYLYRVWMNKENEHLISLIFALGVSAFGIYMLIVPEVAYALLGKLIGLATFLNGLSYLFVRKA